MQAREAAQVYTTWKVLTINIGVEVDLTKKDTYNCVRFGVDDLGAFQLIKNSVPWISVNTASGMLCPLLRFFF